MNTISAVFHKHKHLLVISLMSALLVLTLQVIMSALTQDKENLPPDLRVEDIQAEVISLKQSPLEKTQSISVLNQKEMADYSRQGWVIREVSNTGEMHDPILVEHLQFSFADTDTLQGMQREYTTSLKLPQTPLLKIHICGDDTLTNLCTRYAYNHAGDSIPLLFTLMDNPNTNESILKTTLLSENTRQKMGVFGLAEGLPISIEPLF